MIMVVDLDAHNKLKYLKNRLKEAERKIKQLEDNQKKIQEWFEELYKNLEPKEEEKKN